METAHKRSTVSIRNTAYKSTITIMATLRIFEVSSEEN